MRTHGVVDAVGGEELNKLSAVIWRLSSASLSSAERKTVRE